MRKFDDTVAGAFDVARSRALEGGHTELTPLHLLWGLVSHPGSLSSKCLGSRKKAVARELSELPRAARPVGLDGLQPSPELAEWATRASARAIESGRAEAGEEDFLRLLPKVLPGHPIDEGALAEGLGGEAEAPPFLTDLNALAARGKLDPVVGRRREIRAVMEILGRRSKNNPVLVGPAGVGKTAIVEGLADAIVKGDVPDVLKDKTVHSLDMGALTAGTKFRGEFEERVQKLVAFMRSLGGGGVLFIDEIHQLVGAGGTDGAMDAANLLKPALARGELRCIGATTPEEHQRRILGDPALDRRFRAVPVDEPSKEDAIHILTGIREKLEIHHGIKVSDDAVVGSVLLSDQYLTDKRLPDKAIDLIDEAASALKLSAQTMPARLVELEADIRGKRVAAKMNKDEGLEKEIEETARAFEAEKRKWEEEVLSVKRVSELKNRLERLRFEMEQALRGGDLERAGEIKYSLLPETEKRLAGTERGWTLTRRHVAQVIARQTGVPVEKILKDRQESVLMLGDFLKSRVRGQDEALDEIARALMTSYAGLGDETRPLGSFLLQGPSGVGKTETAKSLAAFLFNRESAMVRLDMSEYSERHSVAKLIGAPAGYVGHEEGGVLTEAVRRRPHSVVLFDEIEKAHRDFADVLLQILDDGRLTDNKGRTIDFKNTVIVLTTNSKDVRRDFKTEVLGRIDAVLSYRPLPEAVLLDLVARQEALLNERLKEKGVSVELDGACRESLARRGRDPDYGARPLASVFKRMVTRPLARGLLAGELRKGVVRATMRDGRVAFA